MAWNYSNISVQTTLTAPVAPGDTTIAIADTTGLPVSFPFSLVLDYQLATVEVVTVTNLVGLTLTVTRGQDGTSAQSHSAGGPVVHGVVARDVAEPQAHIAASQNVHGVGSGNAVVGSGTTQTLTNKSMSGSTNTFTNIPDSAITALAASKLTGNFNPITSTGAIVAGTTLTAASGDITASGKFVAGSPRVQALTVTPATVSVVNTAAETVILSYTVGANTAAVGNSYHLALGGGANIISTPAITIRLRIGGLAGPILAAVNYNGVANTNRPWTIDTHATCQLTGITGTWFGELIHTGQMGGVPALGNVAVWADNTIPVATADTTVNQTLVVTMQWGTASPSNGLFPFRANGVLISA